MSDISFIERNRFEKLFEMGSGYVLNFSNRGLAIFISDSTRKDIYNVCYATGGNSKASRLRTFWEIESNQVVAKLLNDLLVYYSTLTIKSDDNQLFEDCKRAALRLSQDSLVSDIDAIKPNSDDQDFDLLAKLVKEAIENNKPEVGLDRLHTYVTKYMRVLCQKYEISIEKEKPLHSLFAEYSKRLKERNYLESDMSNRILKSSIAILEAFNSVRNNKSFAHDNKILNYEESLLIYRHITAVIKFIDSLEQRNDMEEKTKIIIKQEDDMPF